MEDLLCLVHPVDHGRSSNQWKLLNINALRLATSSGFPRRYGLSSRKRPRLRAARTVHKRGRLWLRRVSRTGIDRSIAAFYSPAAMKTLIRLIACALALAASVWYSVWAADNGTPRSTGRVLVLENERTIEGDIQREENGYRIRRQIGETTVPADKVIRLCASLEEAYEFLRTRANLRDADERMRLAHWCHLRGCANKRSRKRPRPWSCGPIIPSVGTSCKRCNEPPSPGPRRKIHRSARKSSPWRHTRPWTSAPNRWVSSRLGCSPS